MFMYVKVIIVLSQRWCGSLNFFDIRLHNILTKKNYKV